MNLNHITAEEFEQLFREYYSQFYYYAYDILEHEEESQDVVSEAFLSVWNNREHIEREKIRGYLFMCVRNKSLTLYAKHKNQSRLSEDTLSVLAAETDGEWMKREERIRLIEQEMGKMPERTRYVLEQCYYHRRTYREVGEELGITTDGIKKHITKALKHLRTFFNIDKHNN